MKRKKEEFKILEKITLAAKVDKQVVHDLIGSWVICLIQKRSNYLLGAVSSIVVKKSIFHNNEARL